jgi:16S rRNA (guanine527-N7)-methyltransferase
VRLIRGPEDFAAAFRVSRETLARLATYEQLLERWQKSVNLVAPRSLSQVWHRHFADSAQLVRLAPQASSWIDLGSGAGFPGLVVAIVVAERRGCRIALVESDLKKCAFLREVARRTGIAVDILPHRIETVATQAKLPQPDVISARALAPLNQLLRLAAPLFASSTIGLFPKGRRAAAEVEAARQDWQFELDLVPSLTEREGRIAVLRHLRPKTQE